MYGSFALGEVGGSEWHYYLGDGRFSVRQLVDESGNLALTRSYDPFGLVLQETAAVRPCLASWGRRLAVWGCCMWVAVKARRWSIIWSE
jgi:hypothetical protein